MDSKGNEDSPLSIVANITGILTFFVAIAAAAYARISYLRNSDDEYFRVKTSLSWYKTESTWLAELLRALDMQSGSGFHRRQTEYQMYKFVMDDLLNLEQRLLDLVAEIEVKAADGRRKEFSSRGLVIGEDEGDGAGTTTGGTDGSSAVFADEHDIVEDNRLGNEDEGARASHGKELLFLEWGVIDWRIAINEI
ncbi:hypothetical protein PT974_05000 [Cladobotryum mycophilum]|uniref:Prion-inhibition and propagation HeLo domain-containing protein n=1 Tax=Cladobotryum mycophilum TaxID=491253 RepID=A0ABR0SQS6_9HYPO